jgi:hypothetical protein
MLRRIAGPLGSNAVLLNRTMNLGKIQRRLDEEKAGLAAVATSRWTAPAVDLEALHERKQRQLVASKEANTKRREKVERFSVWQAGQREKSAAVRLARMTRKAEAKKRVECRYKSGRILPIAVGLDP